MSCGERALIIIYSQVIKLRKTVCVYTKKGENINFLKIRRIFLIRLAFKLTDIGC